MSTTGAFNIPLSDLGKVSRSTDPAHLNGKETEPEPPQESDGEDLYGMPPLNQYRNVPTQESAVVLASATPSVNTGSQDSNIFEPTQILEDETPEATQMIVEHAPHSSDGLATRQSNPQEQLKPNGILPPHIKARYKERGWLSASGGVEMPDILAPLAPPRRTSTENPSETGGYNKKLAIPTSSPERPLAQPRSKSSSNPPPDSPELATTSKNGQPCQGKLAVPPSEPDATIGSRPQVTPSTPSDGDLGTNPQGDLEFISGKFARSTVCLKLIALQFHLVSGSKQRAILL
jgi:hypothetical protein